MKYFLGILMAAAITVGAQTYNTGTWQDQGTTVSSNYVYATVPVNASCNSLLWWCNNAAAYAEMYYPTGRFIVTNALAAGYSNALVNIGSNVLAKGVMVLIHDKSAGVFQPGEILWNTTGSLFLSNNITGAYLSTKFALASGDEVFPCSKTKIALNALDADSNPIPTTWAGQLLFTTDDRRPLGFGVYLAPGDQGLTNLLLKLFGTR